MDSPESLQQLEELFHEALRLEPRQRADFLAQARMSNPQLADAVESLISAHEQSDNLLDTPALEAAAELLEESRPVLATGRVIAQYEIIAPLGRGGMGDVYLANDAKLNRKVALKLLPARFTESKERLRRFIQEAKAASSLNHPNIITIHEIGEAEGAHFIATEFIEGQTLKRRISQGRMNVGHTLEVAIQVASALQSAHEAGIVHRDIKPENIMLRPDGYVKILDFGLAKLTEKPLQSTSADSRVDTMVQERTRPGTVLGTVKYMSPEQARGRILDQRTDVFSLGVVLYEMAAGQIPFSGETSMDTLVAILEKEPPPLEAYARETPAEFQRIVSKALRKNREERYQTIKDLLIDLKSLKEELSFQQKLDRLAPKRTSLESAATPPVTESISAKQTAAADLSLKESKKKSKTTIIWAALIIVIAGVVVGGTWIWRRGSSSSLKPGPAAPVMDRRLRYRITVQKYRDGEPYQEPFQLGDDINFEKDYRIRLNIASPQSGNLYLLNQGPEGADRVPAFNVLFPSETANNFSTLLNENQEIQIPQQSWFQFDEKQGTERIWVVWSRNPVPEMEAIKGFANSRDRGVITGPGLRTAVNEFLKAHSSSTPVVQRDPDKKETLVRSQGEILVHVIRLEHH